MSRAQIDAALAKANAVKDARAVLRARVKPLEAADGRYELAAILADEAHRDVLASLPVPAFLRWSKRMTDLIVDRYLAEAECSEFRTLGELSERQRGLLAEALRTRREALKAREIERQAA